MYLISTNVYNSVKAPAKRGFSYLEMWILGVQLPIVIGIIEYGIFLAMKRFPLNRIRKIAKNIIKVSSAAETNTDDQKTKDFIQVSRIIDQFAFIFCAVFLAVFNFIFWSVALF